MPIRLDMAYLSFVVSTCRHDGECCGSVVECLTRGQGVAGSNLTAGTVLCP